MRRTWIRRNTLLVLLLPILSTLLVGCELSPEDLFADLMKWAIGPTIDFHAAPRNGEAPLAVLFTIDVARPWPSMVYATPGELDFGDGATATTEIDTGSAASYSVQHTYSTAGEFTATLKVAWPMTSFNYTLKRTVRVTAPSALN